MHTGTNVLHAVSTIGNAFILKWYYEKCKESDYEPLPVDNLDKDGNTALFLACWMGYQGRSMNESDDADVIKKNRLEIVRMLLERGADPNFKSKKLGLTSLHWAAYHGDVEVVKELLRYKAEIKFDIRDNNTPVDFAGFSGRPEVVEIFCD